MNYLEMDTLPVPGVVSMDEASQDETEQSPEPSPVGPPAPQEFPSLPRNNTNGSASHQYETISKIRHYNNYKQSPIVQNELFGEAGDSDSDNDESLPSLPDAPSPYSPPSSSIFSGDEWFKQSNRKTQTHNGNGNNQSGSRHYPPLSEVRLQQSSASSAYSTRSNGNNDNDNDTFYSARSLEQRMQRTLNQNPTAPGRLSLSPASREHWSPAPEHQQQHQHQQPSMVASTPGAAERSLLPAVQTLKKELHLSHENMYLLREENKALAAECDQFEKRIDRWQQQADEQIATAFDRETALSNQVQELHQQNEEVAAMNATLQERVEEYVNGTQLLSQQQQQADGSRDQMEAKLQQELLQVTREKEAATVEVTKAWQENERLAEELSEVVGASRNLQGNGDKKLQLAEEKAESLQKKNADLINRMGELKKDNSNKIKAVKTESEAELADKSKENSSLLYEIDRLKATVKEQSRRGSKENAEVSASVVKLEEEIEKLKKETTNKLETVKTESEAELADKITENSSLRFEIDRLKAMVEEQSRRGSKDTAEASANSDKLEEDIGRLQFLLSESNDGKTKLEADLVNNVKENASLGLEIDRLKALVKELNWSRDTEAAEASASVTKWEKEVDHLHSLLSSNGKAELEAELVERKKEISSLGLEIDRLKAMAKEQGRRGVKETTEASTNTAKLEEKVDNLETRLSESKAKHNEANAKNNALRAEKLALRKELVQRHRSHHDVECQTDSIVEVEVPRKPTGVDAGSQTTGPQTLQTATQTSSLQTPQAATQRTDRQTCDGGTQTTNTIEGPKSFGTQNGTATATTFTGTQTLFEDEAIHSIAPISSSGQNVTERLGRIRDAAERAALLQDYRRDLDRIKTQHETEKEDLTASHNEKLKKVVHHAKTESQSRSKEYKRRLQAEYDAKVSALESKHMQELTRVRTVGCIRRLSLMICRCCCSCSFPVNNDLTLYSFCFLLSYCRNTVLYCVARYSNPDEGRSAKGTEPSH
jgi:hypothetical protein